MSTGLTKRNLNIYQDLQSTCKSFKRRDVVRVLSSRVKRLSNMEDQLNKNIDKFEQKIEEDDGLTRGDEMKYNQTCK